MALTFLVFAVCASLLSVLTNPDAATGSGDPSVIIFLGVIGAVSFAIAIQAKKRSFSNQVTCASCSTPVKVEYRKRDDSDEHHIVGIPISVPSRQPAPAAMPIAPRHPPNAKAQELFQQGVNHREQGDWVMAADLIRQAAVMDHAEAQYNYALMCMQGDGVSRSETEARRWMKKSAQNGFPQAVEYIQMFWPQQL